MSFIIAELDAAIPDLPLNYGASDDGRVTKGAAMAIKARALLYAASPLSNPSNDLAKWQAAADADAPATLRSSSPTWILSMMPKPT